MNLPRPDKPFSKHRSILLSLLILLSLVFYCISPASLQANTPTIEQRDSGHSPNIVYTRIISLYGAHTENIYALGADAQLIGVSVNDNYPEQVDKKLRFSYHDGPEKFIAARPDLVLIRPMIENGYPKFVKQLRTHGITVISLQPSSISAMYTYWLTLGRLTGKTKASEKLVNDFKGKIDSISEFTRQITPKKKVYFQAIHSRMKTFTPEAMPIFALETAGGINIASDAKASRNTNVAIYGKEQILAKADKIDVIIAQKGIMNPIQKGTILNEPGFQIIKAVKEGQVYLIDESIVSRPVPRLLEGVLAIGNRLYPEIFNEHNLKKDKL